MSLLCEWCGNGDEPLPHGPGVCSHIALSCDCRRCQRQNAELVALRAVEAAARVYIAAVEHHAGDDFLVAGRRRPRVSLDKAISALDRVRAGGG